MTATAAWGATAPTSGLNPITIERRTLRGEDVAIDIAYCGVCHSDLHVARNDWGRTTYPFVPGHEIVGTVRAVGDQVTRFRVGDRVAVGTVIDSCRHCDACDEGEENYCREGSTGTYNGKDRIDGSPTYGGYSASIVVAEPFVLRVPDNLDMAAAAPLLPPSAIACNRAGREDTMASSDIANTPLRAISARIISASSQGNGSRSMVMPCT